MTSEGGKEGAGGEWSVEDEKSVICERLVQLSAGAALQEVAGVPASINNALSGVQRGRANERRGERRGEREYTTRPQGQT